MGLMRKSWISRLQKTRRRKNDNSYIEEDTVRTITMAMIWLIHVRRKVHHDSRGLEMEQIKAKKEIDGSASFDIFKRPMTRIHLMLILLWKENSIKSIPSVRTNFDTLIISQQNSVVNHDDSFSFFTIQFLTVCSDRKKSNQPRDRIFLITNWNKKQSKNEQEN